MNAYVGCCCAEDLAAQMQACIDQAVGIVELQKAKLVAPSPEQWATHYTRLTVLMQAALDQYTAQHGTPDADHSVAAAQWLLKELRA